MKLTKLVKAAGAFATVAVIATACGDSAVTSTQAPPATAASEAVTVQQFAFSPDAVTIAAGGTVVWTNQDRIEHTVTAGTPEAPGTVFDRSLDGAGTTTEVTFDTAGTFSYFCSRHPHMLGSITVTE